MTKRMKAFKEKCQANASVYNWLDSNPAVRRDADKVEACQKFFQELKDILEGKYVALGSCNKDISQYLVPVGTEDQVTYYGKPDFSFRISDHWNWYSNLKKCPDVNYIQCNSVDMPKARRREEDGKASKPRRGLQVAIQGTDGKYHHVFGYKWDRKKNEFYWVENSPIDICESWGLV